MASVLGTAGTFDVLFSFVASPATATEVSPKPATEVSKYEIWIADPRTKEMFRIRKNVEGIELALDWALDH